MAAPPASAGYRSIWSPSTRRERVANFEAYWRYTLERDGELLEDEQALTRKREILAWFQSHPVRCAQPLPDVERFYRNHLRMRDDPGTLDRKTLLLTFLYKFARHEFVGISAAWAAGSRISERSSTIARIGRYHLCEEFGHMRLFGEMFRTFRLDRVEWEPLGKWMSRVYRLLPHVPEALRAPAAFLTELMGLTVYLHVDSALDDILADEAAARDRIRALLREIMADELAHVGQRRNFIGPLGLRAARGLLEPMYRGFFRDIPETGRLFDVDRMVRDGRAFDYRAIPEDIVRRSWVPSYCTASREPRGGG